MRLPIFPVEGGCQCGAVRYRLKAAPLGVYACHCKDCQRFSGTTHTLTMMMNAGDVELLQGTLVAFDKAADSGRVVRMQGCIACGTKVWNEPLSSTGMLNVKPGTLDDMSWARPVGHIWTDSAVAWDIIDTRGPVFGGQPADRKPLFEEYAAEVAKG